MIEQKREYYRVEYPVNDRPALLLMDSEFEVIDVSEGGIKFRVPDSERFTIGEIVGATLKFTGNHTFRCKGKIVRIDDDSIAINNIFHIPLEIIRSEHLQLIQKYHAKH